jgi:hypothetical protein
MHRRTGTARLALACLAGIAALAAPAAAAPGDPFDMRSVCREDFERFCSELGTEANRAAIDRCLASHEADLSPACQIAVGEKSDAEREPLPAPAQGRAGHRNPPPHP